MDKIYIIRDKGQADPDQGTYGCLVIPGIYTCFSIELPWRDNKPNVSCLPLGNYEVEWYNSPRFGWLYNIKENIPDRSDFRIHIANYAGDVSLGFKSDVEGCIGLGKSRGLLQPKNYPKVQKAILNSGVAIKEFHKWMDKRPAKLIILEE